MYLELTAGVCASRRLPRDCRVMLCWLCAGQPRAQPAVGDHSRCTRYDYGRHAGGGAQQQPEGLAVLVLRAYGACTGTSVLSELLCLMCLET